MSTPIKPDFSKAKKPAKKVDKQKSEDITFDEEVSFDDDISIELNDVYKETNNTQSEDVEYIDMSSDTDKLAEQTDKKEPKGTRGKKEQRRLILIISSAILLTVGIVVIAILINSNRNKANAKTNENVVSADKIVSDNQQVSDNIVDDIVSDNAIEDNTNKIFSVSLNKVVTGYDNVKTYINEFNNQGKAIVSVPDKEEFYRLSEGNDLVLFNFNVKLLNDIDNSLSSNELSSDLIVEGTSEIDKLITDKVIYVTPRTTDISIDNYTNLSKSVNIRYITVIPLGADASIYRLRLELLINEIEQDIYFDGPTI